MASPKTYIEFSINFFRRNNPVEAVTMGVIQTVYNLVTYNSRMKLLKYRFMLEQQKLARIENTLSSFNPYEHTGAKMDRRY